MFHRKIRKETKRTFCLYGILLLFSAFLLSGLTAQAAGYSKETTIFSSVPSDAKAAPEAPFAGKMERKAAHTMILGGDANIPRVEVVNYAGEVEGKSKDSLTLDTTLSQAEDQATLERLADHIYQKSDGSKYNTVTINWHVGANPEPAAPWARTVITKK